MMDSILSILPRGLFGHHRPSETETVQSGERTVPMEVVVEGESGRKRTRDCDSPSEVYGSSGNATPHLISRQESDITVPSFVDEEDDVRPLKRFRGLIGISFIPSKVEVETPKASKPKEIISLTSMPDDVIAHCLSFLNSTADRRAIQCTSKQFRDISNSDAMMIGIRVGGDPSTGLHGILQEDDTPETAANKLLPFVVAGNLEAIYMLGIIQCYCQRDAKNGISMLEAASAQGYVRASYALGLVLRDSQFDEAKKYMKMAADAKYLPALQELLPAREMKEKYGEPDADELRRHLDHLCLNRLLSRHYVSSPDLRNFGTSHCWNPLCGRWAFKGTGPSRMAARMHQPLLQHNHHGSAHAYEGASTIGNAMNGSTETHTHSEVRVSRMKVCSRCSRAKYCSKLCQVYDWRSGRHKMECQFLGQHEGVR